MTTQSPTGTPGQPGTAISLSFVPSVLAWSDDATHLVAGGSRVFNYGTDGFAVIDTTTGAVSWHLDGWSCVAAQTAGPLVAVCLVRDASDASASLLTSLEVHDLLSGALTWQRDDIGLSETSHLSADPGGRLLAVSTADDYALVDLKTGTDIVPIALTPMSTFRPVLSPTGRQAAVACAQGVAICDTSTGAILYQVATSSAAFVAEFDETGTTLTVVDQDAFVTVINIASANQISRSALSGANIFNPPLAQLLGCPVALSPDRQIVIVAERACNSMYAAATGVRIGVVPATNDPLARVAFSPDARTAVVTQVFAATGRGGDATLIAAPRPQVLWQQTSTKVTAAAFSRSGRLAVAQPAAQPAGTPNAAGQGVILIDVVASEQLLNVAAGAGSGGAVLGVDVSGGGIRLAASACADSAARLYAVDGGQLLYERAHPGALTGIVFAQDGQSFATASTDGGARLFDTVTGVRRWLAQHNGPVNALARPAAGDFVCTASSDKTVRCIDAATGTQRWQAAFPQAVTRVTVSSDGGFVVAACSDRTARLLHAADGTQGWQVQHDARIDALAISPDGTLVATASQDGSVLVLAIQDGTVRRQVSHVQGATSAAFSADSQSVISGSLDGAVLVSPVTDPNAPPAQLIHAVVPVTQIAAGPGRSVAVATQDGLVRIIDLDLQAELARIYSTAPVNDIAIDTAAGLLASGSDDGTLRVDTWDSQ